MYIRQAFIVYCIALLILSCAGRKQGYYHRVAKGETLYRIARAYRVSVDDIGRANNMRNIGYIREGQYLLIPNRQGKRVVSRATKGQKRGKRRYRSAPQILKETNLSGRFVWPLQHKVANSIVERFGKRDKKRNTGIDIKAPAGAGVVAVASGEVVYAGDEVEGFGKTVIIRHKEEIFSIYSYLLEIYTKTGDQVKQGERIASVGRPKTFSAPHAMLHFEIRERTIPVNPENLLP